MKVAVIIDTWFPYLGGGQINAWEVSKRLAKSGVSIDIITRNNGNDNLKTSKNIKVIKLGSRSQPFDTVSKFLFLIKSFFYLYSHQYDLIHAHAFLPGIVARAVVVTKGIPAVFTVHGTSLGTELLGPVQKLIEKFILTQILYSAQITVAKDFLKIKNINENIFYIPNGIKIDNFDRIKTQKSRAVTLLFVGRLHPQKNLPNLIDAFSQVLQNHPNIRLKIAGDGPQKTTLVQKVKSLKLAKSIIFLGEVLGRDLIKLYKSSHLFILPSIY